MSKDNASKYYEKIKSDPDFVAKRKAYHAEWQKKNKDKWNAYIREWRRKKKRDCTKCTHFVSCEPHNGICELYEEGR